jgi:hypothetical protein
MPLMEQIRAWLEPSVQTETEQVFRSLWRDAVRAGSTRHSFHREVLDDLDALIATVGFLPADTLVTVDEVQIRWDELPRRYPKVARCLTDDWMRSFVAAEIARVAAVADSTDILSSYSQDQSSMRIEHWLTVQHRASGLRALFMWQDGNRIGRVNAKSYSITSIDPERHWQHEGIQSVHEWEGLGITSRLYQEAARLEPGRRWGVTMLTDQSAALRRKLHRIDPWRFAATWNVERHPEYSCRWCIDHDWATLDRTAFNWHPTADQNQD